MTGVIEPFPTQLLSDKGTYRAVWAEMQKVASMASMLMLFFLPNSANVWNGNMHSLCNCAISGHWAFNSSCTAKFDACAIYAETQYMFF